jgi:hypothetical protein
MHLMNGPNFGSKVSTKDFVTTVLIMVGMFLVVVGAYLIITG